MSRMVCSAEERRVYGETRSGANGRRRCWIATATPALSVDSEDPGSPGPARDVGLQERRELLGRGRQRPPARTNLVEVHAGGRTDEPTHGDVAIATHRQAERR